MSVLEGQSVRLACKCQGIPFPTLSWWKDGRVLLLSLIPPHTRVEPPDRCWSPWSKECFILSSFQLLGGNWSCWEPEKMLLSPSLGR